MKKRQGLMYPALIALTLFFCFACGIDTLNFLGSDSQPYSESQGDNGLFFSGPISPESPPYSGINLYYRIYASEAEAEIDRSRLEQRQSSDSVPGSSVPNFLVATLQYVRPARNDNRDPPTIPTTIETASMGITLIEENLFLKIGSVYYDLKRNIPGSLLQDFSEKPLEGDEDYSSVPPTPTVPGGPLYVQFFAASYGFNFLGSTPELFSNAVFLGRIVLTASD